MRAIEPSGLISVIWQEIEGSFAVGGAGVGVEANGAEAGLAEHVGDGGQAGAAAERVVANVWRPTWAVMCSSSRLASAAMARMMSLAPRTASHQHALDLFRRLGDRQGQAEVLNSLGELASRTTDGGQACDHHAQALAIARDLGTPRGSTRLEGTGRSHLRDGHPSEAAACLEQALALYQRIAAPAARRVQETLLQFRHGNLAPAPDR